tara:strand:- start:24 stop:353 length:330 start_codon:yes stop_codon:yes gene_type:complete
MTNGLRIHAHGEIGIMLVSKTSVFSSSLNGRAKIKIMRLHTNKWNKRDKEFTMFIITEEDIINDDINVRGGAGFEILVIPNKYKDLEHKDVSLAKAIVLSRVGGQIIYV